MSRRVQSTFSLLTSRQALGTDVDHRMSRTVILIGCAAVALGGAAAIVYILFSGGGGGSKKVQFFFIIIIMYINP